ncbi:MAG: C25 family cysteine peptidase [Anaerolineae bacterium]
MPDPAIYRVNAFYPASPVVPGAVQTSKGRRQLALAVFPFQYNPITRQVRYSPDVQVRIEITEEGATQPDTGLLTALNLPASSAGALRIRTSQPGLHRLTYEDLLAAGVPIAATDPTSFAMSYLGQPVAIQVIGEDDGQFNPGDLVVFYAQPYQGRYQRDNVLWLTYGGAPGLRMATRAVAPSGNEPVITTITRTVQVELNREYRSDYPRPQDADHWFDTPLSPDDLAGTPTLTRSYTLPVVDPLPGGALRIQAALHGGVDRPANPDKSIAIALNSHSVAIHQWEGKTYYVSDDWVPATWLDGAPNRIHLTAATAQLPGIEFYSVSPDWVRVTYPSLASAQADRLTIEAMAAGVNQVTTSGWSTPDVRVYDLRNPTGPVRLLTTAAQLAGSTYELTFWDAILPGPTYALSSVAALLAPLAVEADTPSSWGTPGHQADYIAIVHRSLWQAIDPLLAHRTAEGLSVAKVDVQDIYDEWSYGRRDPEAIRSFLTYAYRCWNSGPCAPPPAQPANPPRYVLLVGDGHYDFTGASGTAYPNLIPPYLIHIDPWLGETAADNRFVSVDGPSDYLPEMAIGRIPARTPADVTAVVNKVIAYETSAPAGDWQQRVVFVADNHLDPAGDFHAYSDDVRLNWLPASYDDRMIYYNRDYFSGDAMRTAIKAAFNADALMVQWFGHGSKFRWGSVSMFHAQSPADVSALAANDTWPFTVSYSCWSGYFINLFPSGNGQSLAETLLLTPQRGSVADLSPSGLHIGDALLTLNRGLVDAVFRQRIERAGDAVNAAHQYYFGQTASFHDVIDTSVYFGDPALKLRLPAPPLAVTLASFEAEAQDDAVLVTWQTVSEHDTLGFNLYRSQAPDQLGELLAFTPAQSPGSSQGATYSYSDTAVVPGQSYWYTLEDLDSGGVATQHGPVGVTVEQPTAVRVGQIEAGHAPAAGLWQRLLAALGR